MKILYITEGDRDVPLYAIISRIGSEVLNDRYPVLPDDINMYFQRPKRGYGWIKTALERVDRYLAGKRKDTELSEISPIYDFIVVALDNRAKTKDSCIRLARKLDAVLGIAIEEFEAWILGDIVSIMTFLDLDDNELIACGMDENYNPEKDKHPKKTLNCLTETSFWKTPWDSSLSAMLCEEWRESLDLEALKTACPKGFRPFAKRLRERMQQALGKLPLQ